MNFSEAMFYENYLTSDFHTNTVISSRVCLLVKMASKTVIRPINLLVHRCQSSRASKKAANDEQRINSAVYVEVNP